MKERARNLEDVVENMKSFVDKISDYEGVELDDGEELDDVRFDPDSFSNAMERILGEFTFICGILVVERVVVVYELN